MIKTTEMGSRGRHRPGEVAKSPTLLCSVFVWSYSSLSHYWSLFTAYVHAIYCFTLHRNV